jgi:hypothetical protein
LCLCPWNATRLPAWRKGGICMSAITRKRGSCIAGLTILVAGQSALGNGLRDHGLEYSNPHTGDDQAPEPNAVRSNRSGTEPFIDRPRKEAHRTSVARSIAIAKDGSKVSAAKPPHIQQDQRRPASSSGDKRAIRADPNLRTSGPSPAKRAGRGGRDRREAYNPVTGRWHMGFRNANGSRDYLNARTGQSLHGFKNGQGNQDLLNPRTGRWLLGFKKNDGTVDYLNPRTGRWLWEARRNRTRPPVVRRRVLPSIKRPPSDQHRAPGRSQDMRGVQRRGRVNRR